MSGRVLFFAAVTVFAIGFTVWFHRVRCRVRRARRTLHTFRSRMAV